MSQGKFILIDGNSLVYRAFYALPLLSTKEGVFTNAVYGFTNMLLKVLKDEEPSCIAIAFDKGKVTFRNEQYESYKANRKATPDELRPQFPLVKDVVRAMRIPVYELEGYEADDIIGTVSLKAEEQGYETLIVTGDRDALQLISPRTKVMLTKKGISEMELYDEAKVMERYGITPEQVVDIKGLMGDTSDNIPGVPGVGEKTAIKLVKEYGTVEALLARLDEIKGKLREKLENNKDQANLSKQLATIDRKVPMELDLRDCVAGEPDYRALLELGRKLQFKALIKLAQEKIGEVNAPEGEAIVQDSTAKPYQGDYSLVSREEALAELEALQEGSDLALVLQLTSQDPLEAELQGIAWSFAKGQAKFMEIPQGEGLFASYPDILPKLINIINIKGIKLKLYDAKKAIVFLRRTGLALQESPFDVMLAAYLLDPALSVQAPDKLAEKYLGVERPLRENFTDFCAQADFVLQLPAVLDKALADSGMSDLYYKVELPLMSVLAEMESFGVALNQSYLKDMAKELGARIETITGQIYEIAGEKFNINSTKQLGSILFEKLELPVVKKTKTGYSTDVEVLETLAERHEIVALILHYRQLVKLKSTYVDGLMALIKRESGKVHTTFNQAITATGRLSSTEPNLQNIPIRLEEGRRIRKAFVPSEEGWLLLSADYSQIELRILAHLSGDPKFLQAFRSDEDIHTRTAAEVFGVPIEEVTREMRGQAKAVNFGIVYGISDYGLAKNIAVSRKEAKAYIENYFARYAGVKEYLDNSVRQAKELGYVTTLLNRRRYLPDILSPNRNIRNFGERTAMNTPIQGSAADIIKLAMVRVDEALRTRKLKTRMLLQVHDELIFEVPPEELEKVSALVRESMEKAVELEVPLKVDMKKGGNWYDMEKFND